MYGCKPRREKVGILLAQLGTPDAPTPKALRKYLRQFLSDPRVIELNPIFWQILLNCVILVKRPAQSAKLYKRVWTEQGSPLLITTQNQAKKLGERFIDNTNIVVEIGMRYGQPSLENAVKKLIAADCSRIILIPLYPQYAGATTGSTYDAVFAALLKEREVPTLRCVDPFFDNDIFINAVANDVNNYIKNSKEPLDRIILSYHGVPRRYVESGDPYCCQCTTTTKLIAAKVNFDRSKILHSYQSRFGKEPWLTPYTDELVSSLAAQGVKRIGVACPGFTTDCLETIDEIGHELKEQFLEEGGINLDLIPCLNDRDPFIDCLEDLVRKTASDWINTDPKSIDNRVNCPAEILCRDLWSINAV